MLATWDLLPEDLQVTLAQRALVRAAAAIAGQAETLAGEMDEGTLPDHGGPDALRLFAAVLRATLVAGGAAAGWCPAGSA